MPKALITGISGQTGSYLAEFLLDAGYEVHGIIRRSSNFNTDRIDHIYDDIHLHYGDLSSSNSLNGVMCKVCPDEVYNLAAMSHVRVSFDDPIYSMDINATGTLRMLECIKQLNDSTGKTVKFYQASSSEMFGSASPPQSETTLFHPRSPYACSKVAAYYLTVNYREAYGMHASNGILFNHESTRRGGTFVTKKITRAVARIVHNKQTELVLGNISAKRDWGHAKDYVRAMHMMLQHEEPGDYVVATGETHSVEELLDVAFNYVGLNWRDYVRIDERYFRPSEVDVLLGDATKIKNTLGWEPRIKFHELIHEMLQDDLVAESGK